jgi:flagellar biosynthesis protein FlhA
MIGVLVVLILPMPSRLLLDLLLALSITFSVLVPPTSLFVVRPLEFSSFPAVLLIADHAPGCDSTSRRPG